MPCGGHPLPLLPDTALRLLAAVAPPGRFRRAVLQELDVRNGSDRSGLRVLPSEALL